MPQAVCDVRTCVSRDGCRAYVLRGVHEMCQWVIPLCVIFFYVVKNGVAVDISDVFDMAIKCCPKLVVK